jgi:D-alanine-D-alanine ligase
MGFVVDDAHVGGRLRALRDDVLSRASELAVFLAFDRPQRVEERPGLARAYFAQRCATDRELSDLITAYRSIGAYVELMEGEQDLIRALATGRLQAVPRTLKIIYNGIEGGIAWDGFAPGRKALIPAVADSYGVVCSNSSAYGCALGRHKFHYFIVLDRLGLRVPATWHYRPSRGWAGGERPRAGMKVIVKSTYESWSVGVTIESIFVVDNTIDARVATIAARLGQPVTVQEFIEGTEVGVPIFGAPEPVVAPPMETILSKSPGDPAAVTTIDDNLDESAITHRRYDGKPKVMAQLHAATTRAFDVLELRGFARLDFRVDATGTAWVTDVGVSPGITVLDSAYRSLAELGFDHSAFLHVVLGATLASSRARTQWQEA